MKTITEQQFAKLVCEQVAIQARTSLADWPMVAASARIDAFVDLATQDLIISMRSLLLEGVEGNVGYISVPATWWQQLKEEYWPEWALRRWPVQYRQIKYVTKYVCPHSREVWPDRKHMTFLSNGPQL